jgi:S-DNA-T family DNA segregation ATPase FtsK/SpoIIIE
MSNPRQIRHQARKLRRHGIQPMVFLGGPNDGAPPGGVILLRLLWRYRSELAPVGVAGALLFLGWRFHAARTHWEVVAGATASCACAMAILGRHIGAAAGLERVYAVTVVVAAGVWLSAATVLSSGTAPLPQLLLFGGSLLAVPWWTHRRRLARVRVERKLEAWPDIAQAVGLVGSQVMSAAVDVWGWRARIRLARGQTISDVIAKIPALESALGTFRGAVRVYPTTDDLAHRCELRVLEIDPHADAIPWPGPSVSSITEPIELGPFEDGAPCRVLFLRRHALLGGGTGSGKSGGLNVLMGNLSACRDVVIWAIDLKRGIELGPWAPCIDRLAVTPDQARALLHDAVTILEARATQLATEGRRTWEPTPERPALVIVIDEYAELADDVPEAMADADSIARLGRAVAESIIAATQRPTQKAMGQGAVRSQMDVRISFRVRERKDVDLILGQGMLAAGWQAQALDAPGKFLVSAADLRTPRRARAYLLTDETVAQTAEHYAPLRPQLDETSRLALDGHQAPSAPSEPEAVDANAPGPGLQWGSGEQLDPEAVLWAALSFASADGISVTDLVTETGMSRRWVYYRLQDLAATGQATQVSRGLWRAAIEGPADA